MPNLGSVLKLEIARLAKRSTKQQFAALAKANATYRHDIAALKREVAELQRRMKKLDRSAAKTTGVVEAADESTPRRFSAKGLKSHRARLGLSAMDFGHLVGVAGQTIYNWESGSTVPRSTQLERLAAVRKLGKRAVAAQLAESKDT
jgi:DNA-binding transcriptional regulator YiaG